MVEMGSTILNYQNKIRDDAVVEGKVGWVDIAGHRVPCVNTTILVSEVAGCLAETYSDAPFGAIFFVLNTGEVVYSLRSRGEFDVSEVAKQYGGGGHKNAAGFKIDKLLPITPR